MDVRSAGAGDKALDGDGTRVGADAGGSEPGGAVLDEAGAGPGVQDVELARAGAPEAGAADAACGVDHDAP